jgi:hypothetical protein
MKKIVLMLGFAMACDCEPAQELVFEEPAECIPETFPTDAPQCKRPSACCDLGVDGMAAICATYYPKQPTPVMCSSGALPMNYVCARPTEQVFDCEWGESDLVCCKID